MKIDRPGAAIIGAVLMVAFRIVGAQEALASIDFATIVLLFSMMLVVANLRLAGFFERIAEWIIERLHPHHLLPTVIFTSGLLSAFLVNDIVCLVMTPFVLHMARRLGLPPVPYVLAVATASNIGSVATITGNPQNMLIGSLSGISLPRLHRPPWTDRRRRAVPELGAAASHLPARGASIASASHGRCPRRSSSTADAEEAGRRAGDRARWLFRRRASGDDGRHRRGPAADHADRWSHAQVYDEVDWGLLVFFVGLFIIVAGAERAGLTASLLEPVAAWDLHRLPIFVAVTAALSNIVSNVPAVMLLRTLVVELPGSARRLAGPRDGVDAGRVT